jgi:hypothetical protein
MKTLRRVENVDTGLSILRGLVAVCITVLESKMQSDPSVMRSKVPWKVGRGGAAPAQDTLPLVVTSSLMSRSNDDDGVDDESSALEMVPLPCATPPGQSTQNADTPPAAQNHELESLLSGNPETTDCMKTDDPIDDGRNADGSDFQHERVYREERAAAWPRGTEMASVLAGRGRPAPGLPSAGRPHSCTTTQGGRLA